VNEILHLQVKTIDIFSPTIMTSVAHKILTLKLASWRILKKIF